MGTICQPFTALNALNLNLKRNPTAFCYHAVREAVAMGVLLAGHVKRDENPADILTKAVGGGIKMKNLAQMYLYDIHDGW